MSGDGRKETKDGDEDEGMPRVIISTRVEAK